MFDFTDDDRMRSLVERAPHNAFQNGFASVQHGAAILPDAMRHIPEGVAGSRRKVLRKVLLG